MIIGKDFNLDKVSRLQTHQNFKIKFRKIL